MFPTTGQMFHTARQSIQELFVINRIVQQTFKLSLITATVLESILLAKHISGSGLHLQPEFDFKCRP
jgi:hypothetical protein